MLKYTACYLVFFGVLITILSCYVSYMRFKVGVFYGDGGKDKLARARRAHYTVLEYSIIFLLLLAAYEILGGTNQWIKPLGIVFIISRLMHVYHMLKLKPKSALRGLGSVGSHVCTIIVAVKLCILVCEKFA